MVQVLIAISAQWRCERLVALNTSMKPLKSYPKSIPGILSCMTPQGYVMEFRGIAGIVIIIHSY